MKKTCTICKIEKPLTEFHRNCKSPDGHLHQCKPCILKKNKTLYNTDLEYRLGKLWTTLLQRIGNKNGKNPSYASVQLQMTKNEFLTWGVPKFAQFIKENPDAKPSIDRKNSDLHYSIDNLQILAWGENSKKRKNNKNLNAPDGHAWCSVCCQYKPLSRFFRNKAQAYGRDSYCKDCHSEARKEAFRILRARAEANKDKS